MKIFDRIIESNLYKYDISKSINFLVVSVQILHKSHIRFCTQQTIEKFKKTKQNK